MTLKIITIALTLPLLVAACGGGGGSGAGSSETKSSAAAPTQSTPSTPTTPVTTTGLSPVCAAYYASNGVALTSAQTLNAIPTNAKPAKGAIDTQSTFHTCVVRATNHTLDSVTGSAHNEYSRRQAFNADNTKQLVMSTDGYIHIYDATTHAHLSKLPSFGVDPEPQWHSTNPDLLYIIPNQGQELKLKQINVVTGVVSVVGDYGPQLKAIWPQAGLAYTKDEGSPSANGRYWCFMVRDPSTSVNGSWAMLGVFTWDRDTNQIMSSMAMPNETPDHVSMSPSGKYCVVSSDGPTGTTAFLATDFTKKTPLLGQSAHSDLAIAADGRDVFVSASYQNSAFASDGEMFFTYLDTGEKVTLIANIYHQPTTYIGAVHFSGKAFNKPGWVLLDTDADDGEPANGTADAPPTGWMQRKVMAVQLKANPTIYSLAFSRSIYMAGGSAAPLASVSRDFTKIAFNSNWGIATGSDVDVYMIELPVDALK